MPELPEVETVRRGLSRLIEGLVITGVSHDNPKSFPNAPADVDKFLIGAEIVAVKRRAKVLLIELSTKYSLIIHLKMTGQMVYVLQKDKEGDTRFGAGHPNDSLIGALPDKSTRVTFDLSNGAHLYFNDQRKFGWVRLVPTAEIPMIDFFKKVGPEPLAADFTWHIMQQRLERRKGTNIKAALLDQSVIAGVGNIYADESLWGSRIHPTTLVRDLTGKNFKDLHKALTDVLQLSISKGGSTDQHYVDAEGQRGKYLTFASVFRREGQPCPRCGTIIEKSRVAGRGTHTCPYCQKP
ncbi:MAG TPA: bifunctional DNA-formamidopyrimidine glycosylase/DNA-(apurinic or apyrimidinic site) lyase [Candidatus Saccharimonadales bacterium]|nr:bifunctional DNA-formamidopyrimidine glycosylase/DNA-(apurinic or apyrimidinic site) lyase [Candidatus Saccharimonadales bacterium]